MHFEDPETVIGAVTSLVSDSVHRFRESERVREDVDEPRPDHHEDHDERDDLLAVQFRELHAPDSAPPDIGVPPRSSRVRNASPVCSRAEWF